MRLSDKAAAFFNALICKVVGEDRYFEHTQNKCLYFRYTFLKKRGTIFS